MSRSGSIGKRAWLTGLTRAAAPRHTGGISSTPTESLVSLPPAARKSPGFPAPSGATEPHDLLTKRKIPAESIDRGEVV